MAVVSINKIGTLSGSERSLQLTEMWQAVLDDPATDINAIYADTRLPQPGQVHPSVGFLFCFDRRPTVSLDSRSVWQIEVEWSQSVVDDNILETVLASSNPTSFTDPEYRRPTKSWQTSEVMREYRKHQGTKFGQLRRFNTIIEQYDVGWMIRNTAHVAPTVPPTYRSFGRIFTLTRYEAGYNEQLAEEYLGKVNNSVWKNKPEYTVLCTAIDAENKYVQVGLQEPRELALVTYRFEHDPRGHWEDLPNVGLEYRNVADDKTTPILGDDDLPVATPQFLDKNGQVVPLSELPAAELYIRLFPYDEVDFGPLGLE